MLTRYLAVLVILVLRTSVEFFFYRAVWYSGPVQLLRPVWLRQWQLSPLQWTTAPVHVQGIEAKVQSQHSGPPPPKHVVHGSRSVSTTTPFVPDVSGQSSSHGHRSGDTLLRQRGGRQTGGLEEPEEGKGGRSFTFGRLHQPLQRRFCKPAERMWRSSASVWTSSR